MDTPTLTLEEVAELACIEAATLHDWLKLNGPFNAPSGDIEQLGPFTALAICIAAELVRRNFEISRAARAGMKFAHTDDGSPQRNYPGALYGRGVGTTVLAMDMSGEVRIVPIMAISNARPQEIATALFGDRGVLAIVVNPFVAQIERKIGAAFASLPRKQMQWLGT
jgi:hypothetical protein